MNTGHRGMRDARLKWLLSGVVAMIAVAGMAGSAAAEHVGANHTRPTVESTMPAYTPVAPVNGRLTIAGSDTMQPLITKLALEFRRWHPEVKIAVQGSRNHQESTEYPLFQPLLDGLANSRRGDGKTSGHFGSNEVRLLASSRELTPDEIKQFASRYGYEPTAIPVAQDAVAIYVHRGNPIPGLTLEQLDAIFSKTRKRGIQSPLLTWREAGVEEWLDVPLHLYGRDKRSSGTRPFFAHTVLLDGDFNDRVREEPGSASIVLAVASDPYGIGYSGIGFQSTGVREVPLAESAGMPFVQPTNETVKTGAYPLSRNLYLYVNKAPNTDLPAAIMEFLTFINSHPGQQTVVKAGVYPLTATQAAKNLRTLTGPEVRAASPSSQMEQAKN